MKKMTREELQHLLDSYNQETGHIKEWMIDRNLRLQGMAKDARAAGNNSTTRKERVKQSNSHKRKLSIRQIREMKDLYRNDISIGFPELAEKYGVDKVTIHNIMHGLIYEGIGGDVVIRTPLHTCPHCGTTTIKTNITRFHGDKCKLKD